MNEGMKRNVRFEKLRLKLTCPAMPESILLNLVNLPLRCFCWIVLIHCCIIHFRTWKWMLQLVKFQTSDDPNPEKLQKTQGKSAISSHVLITGRPPDSSLLSTMTAITIRQGGKYALRHLYQHFLLNSQAKPAIAIVRATSEKNDAAPSSH